jgi:hypothetical protein
MLMTVLHWHSDVPRGCMHVGLGAPLQAVSHRRTCARQTLDLGLNGAVFFLGIGKLPPSPLAEIVEVWCDPTSVESDQPQQESIFAMYS